MHVFVILISFSINLDESMILPFSPRCREVQCCIQKVGVN